MLVVYHDEEIEDSLPYTLELARIMNLALLILMIYRRKVMERFKDYMVATTFAEEGEFMTARELIIDDLKRKGMDYEERLKTIKDRCSAAKVELLSVNVSSGNIISAIKNILRGYSPIEMVLLSPSITCEGHISTKELQRLVKEISRPIVTMAKNIREKVG